MFFECSRCGITVDGLVEPEDVPLSTLLALRAFKAAISRDPNGALDTWNEDTPVCQWRGVFCNDCGDVTGLCAHPTPPFGSYLEAGATLFHHACGRLRRPPCRGQDANLVSMRHSESAGPPHTTNGGALPRALASAPNVWPARGGLANRAVSTSLTRGQLRRRVMLRPDRRDLGNNDLSGTIPPAIGNLTSLVYLYALPSSPYLFLIKVPVSQGH